MGLGDNSEAFPVLNISRRRGAAPGKADVGGGAEGEAPDTFEPRLRLYPKPKS